MPTAASLRTFAQALSLFTWGATLPAQQPSARPAGTRLGFSVERLARIDSFYQRAADGGRIAGAVVLVLRDGKTAYERAFGWSDSDARRRMTSDAIFRIASQSKAITSVAVMMLAEEGRLALNDRVSRFIPAFGKTTVTLHTERGDSIVPARRAITIRDLLTHTAGISYGTEAEVASLYEAKGLGPAAGDGWYTADKNEPICTTMERVASLPFIAQPGERWVYGYNTDILGCVIERVSGMPLDQYIRTRITAPLKMRDTDFFLPAGKRERLATVYMKGSDGTPMRAPNGPHGQGDYVEGPRQSFSGGAGLLSTARDYARFLQMLLNKGELDGTRVLGPKTVELMTSNQTGSLFPLDGEGFSLGFSTRERLGARGQVESLGTFGWGGAYGTMYLVDPRERLVLVYMIQELPGMSDTGGHLSMLVYQALVESRPQ
jgi:CubicO group peptidase (beta-lactamase class C family)